LEKALNLVRSLLVQYQQTGQTLTRTLTQPRERRSSINEGQSRVKKSLMSEGQLSDGYKLVMDKDEKVLDWFNIYSIPRRLRGLSGKIVGYSIDEEEQLTLNIPSHLGWNIFDFSNEKGDYRNKGVELIFENGRLIRFDVFLTGGKKSIQISEVIVVGDISHAVINWASKESGFSETLEVVANYDVAEDYERKENMEIFMKIIEEFEGRNLDLEIEQYFFSEYGFADGCTER